MTIQYALPNGGYISDTGSVQFAVPSMGGTGAGGYENENSSPPPPPPPPPTNNFIYAKRRDYYVEPYTGRAAFIRRKAMLASTGFIPLPPPVPFVNKAKAVAFYSRAEPVRLRVPRAKTLALNASPPELNVVRIDALVREVLVTGTGVMAVDGVVREILVHNTGPLLIDAVIREVLGSAPPSTGPIPIFPELPYGFPVKVRPTLSTTIGASTSDREVRMALQPYPLWEVDLLFEELRDQGPNIEAYTPLAGYKQYEQLVQLWLYMYGTGSVFAFDAPWDNSREDQPTGVGDGLHYIFTIFRTWGQGTASLSEPIGAINEVFDVSLDGVTVARSNWYVDRNKIFFIDDKGFGLPPPSGAIITMTFSFYYICRFADNAQDFEQFSEGRWTVGALKFQSVYWP